MTIKVRHKVREWRVTSYFYGYIVRYWIEGSVEHGGVATHDAAQAQVDKAEDMTRKAKAIARRAGDVRLAPGPTQKDLADYLLDRIPAANSVEVCTQDGNGVALHRDWP